MELIEYKKTKSRERKTIKVKNNVVSITYLLYINITFFSSTFGKSGAKL
jgi:hypothetical protein